MHTVNLPVCASPYPYCKSHRQSVPGNLSIIVSQRCYAAHTNRLALKLVGIHSFSFSNLQSGVWSQLWLIRHPGLKAQVYVVCNKTKLVGVLFEKEPNVPLLVVWAK